MFSFLSSRYKPPVHIPTKHWHVPLDWRTKPKVGYSVTAFFEDLPQTCLVCKSKTDFEELEPMYIEGELQYMKRVQFCPNGCGFTVWIA